MLTRESLAPGWNASTLERDTASYYDSSNDFSGTYPTSPTRSDGMFGDASTILGLFGAFTGGIGSFYSARSRRSSSLFQADMSDFNARQFERSAQDILHQAQIKQSHISLKAGKVRSSQVAGQGARGIEIGVGSAAEEVATTDLMKEIDRMQINANATREASAMRMRAVSEQNDALLQRASARSSSPFLSGLTSFIGDALPVAASWYRRREG